MKKDPKPTTWRAPTRRTFVAMIGAAAAALALRGRTAKAAPPPAGGTVPSPAPRKPRWIGHC